MSILVYFQMEKVTYYHGHCYHMDNSCQLLQQLPVTPELAICLVPSPSVPLIARQNGVTSPLLSKEKADRWIADLPILGPFQQYFSYFKMMGG